MIAAPEVGAGKPAPVRGLAAGHASDDALLVDVQVQALAERNARRAEEGLAPLTPGDKGKQGRVLQVFPDTQRVLVEGVGRVKKHTRISSTQRGAQQGGLALALGLKRVGLVLQGRGRSRAGTDSRR